MIKVGRIKTVAVKRVSKRLIREHLDDFSEDFNKNKEVLKRFIITKSPKMRNMIAGYASRLFRQAKSGKERRRTNVEDISKFY